MSFVVGRSLFRDISAGWQQWLATIVLVAIQVPIILVHRSNSIRHIVDVILANIINAQITVFLLRFHAQTAELIFMNLGIEKKEPFLLCGNPHGLSPPRRRGGV